jgi:hypothetical protein
LIPYRAQLHTFKLKPLFFWQIAYCLHGFVLTINPFVFVRAHYVYTYRDLDLQATPRP